MSAQAKFARGSKFGIKAHGDGSTYTYVGDLATINIPEPETDEIDVSTLDSPGVAKEFILGATDPGEFTVEGNHVSGDAGQQAVKTAYAERAQIDWIIQTPAKGEETAGATLAGTGYISACNPFGSIEEGSLIPFSATVRVSGETTYTAAVVPDLS
jgi:hypothetical protein